MYTLDVYRVAPQDSRTFIRLKDNHNFGKRFELVCWVSGSDKDGLVTSDYLALLYKFELELKEHIGTIDFKDGVARIKRALIKHQQSTTYRFYHSYICISVKRFLAELLDDYSYNLLYNKSAQKIQKLWLTKYYDPNSEVCKKRLFREFNEMHPYLFK
jgi:hypothetical protein